MKNITKIFTLLALAGMAFASCIEEPVLQSSTATAEQIGASSSALEASVAGIPAQMSQGYLVYGTQNDETDMAYPALMIAQTELLGDLFPLGSNSGYDWYRTYNTFESGTGYQYVRTYIPWRTLYMFVKSANDVIGTVDVDDEEVSDEIKGLAGIAYASRAHAYYLLGVFYEPEDNIYTDVKALLGLTVPIVKPETTGEEIKNNPRAKHEDLVAFILDDLKTAEKCLQNYTPDSKYYPNLAVVYGLMAKVYMWDKKYAEAAEYARKAIDTSGATPLTAAEITDLNTGFNTVKKAWMWAFKYSAENMGNLCNFTGWMSGEADWGYASLTCPGINANLYAKISDTDYRKKLWLDPDRSKFKYETSRDQAFLDAAPDYFSLKFRCVGGDWEDYTVGGACDVPVMRVEEMYLLEAEAVGLSKSVGEGMALLNTFMKTYRDPEYNKNITDQREFQLEVLTQERIEFWGEGNAFPNAKRIKPDIIQNFEGTNAPNDNFKINCKGMKPNWNFVIPRSEIENNNAISKAQNNPDPAKTVVGPTPEGTFAPGNN